MQAKTITIVKPGSGDDGERDAYDIEIHPGMTGKQVLEQSGVGGDYNLTKGDGSRPIDVSAELFPLVSEGEKLFATTAARVGRMAAA